MRRFEGRAALVVALTALVVALGGTALATSYVITSSSQIKDGAVASADVKNSSLTGTDLKDGSVASADVKNGSLTGADVKDRSLSPKDFNGSVTGPPGPQGPAGQKGAAGEDGAYLVSLGGAVKTSIGPTVITPSPEGIVVATAEVGFEPYTEYLSMAFVNVEGDGRATCRFAESGGAVAPDSFIAEVGQIGLLGTTLQKPERFTGTLVTDYPALIARGSDLQFQLRCQDQNDLQSPTQVVVSGRIVTLFF